MKQKLFTLMCLFSLILTSAQAQDARAILDRAYTTYTKAGGITANFTLDTKDSKTQNVYSYDGKVYMKGNKFKIEIPDATTWFDGTTQWVYVKDTEEVNISNPTGEDLQGMSPSALFGIYKKGFNLTYKGEKKKAGKSVFEIELVPQKKNADIRKINVFIDKATNIFQQIILLDKSGLQNTLSIKNYKTGANLPDANFVFNRKEYPKADIVDLR